MWTQRKHRSHIAASRFSHCKTLPYHLAKRDKLLAKRLGLKPVRTW